MQELLNEQFFTDIPLEHLLALMPAVRVRKASILRRNDDDLGVDDGDETGWCAPLMERLRWRHASGSAGRAARLDWDD